jgi:hypothetical protein
MRLARPPEGVAVPEPVPVRRSVFAAPGVVAPTDGLVLEVELDSLGSVCPFDMDDKVGTAGADAIPRSPSGCTAVERLCPAVVGIGLLGGGDAAKSRHLMAATACAALLTPMGCDGGSFAPGRLSTLALPSETSGFPTTATGGAAAASCSASFVLEGSRTSSAAPFSSEVVDSFEVNGSSSASACLAAAGCPALSNATSSCGGNPIVSAPPAELDSASTDIWILRLLDCPSAAVPNARPVLLRRRNARSWFLTLAHRRSRLRNPTVSTRSAAFLSKALQEVNWILKQQSTRHRNLRKGRTGVGELSDRRNDQELSTGFPA